MMIGISTLLALRLEHTPKGKTLQEARKEVSWFDLHQPFSVRLRFARGLSIAA